jgi:sulfur-carrier protein
MVAIAVLFLGTGLEYLNGVAMQGMTTDQYAEAVTAGLADPIRACGNRDCASYANLVGICAALGGSRPDAADRVGVFLEVPALPAGRQEMIDVLYFAWVRERIGLPRERLETKAATVADLVASFGRGKNAMRRLSPTSSLRVALDQELADFDAPLAGVREVAFFPPMTGG